MQRIAFLPRGRIVLEIALTLLSTSLAITVPALGAADDPDSRATLRGIKAIRVLVESMRPDAERDGLRKAQLQSEVKLRLQKAGITVTPSAAAFLYVSVNTAKKTILGMPYYAFNIDVQVAQQVSLNRDPNIVNLAATWGVGYIGTVGAQKLGDVRASVADLVDKFIKAYLEQNPKP